MEHNPPPIRILHLDDNPADLQLTRALIEETDHGFSASIESVTTKEAYLSALHSHSYDLILSDYRMSGYDGDGALKDARAICPDVPFIMVTGELGEERAIETLKAGATDYVLKDRIRRLVPSIKRALKDAQLEQERRETTARLIEAQRLAHIGNWEWNIQTGEVHWSAETFSIYGVDPGAFVPTIDAFAQFVHPDDREFVNGKIKEILGSGASVNFDFRIIAFDGSRHVLHTVGAIKKCDAQGKPLVMAGTNQDITERKRIEESEERLKALMSHNPSLVFLKDESGRYVYLNEAYETQFVHAKDWVGKTDFDFWPKESAELFRANDMEVMKAGQVRQVLEDSTDRKGERHCWLAYKFPFIDSAGKRYVGGIGIDATDRVRAEEALKKSEERVRSLAENLPSVLMRYDREFRVVYLSPTAEAFTGISVEEFLGKTNREVGMPEHLCALWEGAIEEVFRTGANRDVEFSFQAAEGFKTFFLRFAPEKAADGTIDYVLGISTDITERKQAEEELAAAYNQIQSIIDNTPAIVYAFDLEERFVIANTALAELLNSTPKAMLGKRRHEFMPREDADWHEANDRQVFEAGKALEFEEQSQLQGRAITWLTTKFPLRDAQGKIYAIAGISSDISERKLAEAKLAESEEKYRDLFEKMSEGFLLVEPIYSEAGSPVSYYYRDANPALEQLTHLKRTEILGKTAHEVLGVVEPYWVDCFARVAKSGESERIEEHSEALGGWYSVYVYCPKPGMAALIYTNVTERRKAEEALAASERKHRELLQTANSIILRWDNQGILRYVNDYGLRFFGYTAEELIGRDVMTLAPKVEASTGRSLESLVNDILQAPERFTDYANENIRKDGTTVWVAWTNKAILDEQGKVREILAIGNDITPLKEAEAALQGKEEELREAQRLGRIGSWYFDARTGESTGSEEIYRIFGFDPAKPLPTLNETLEDILEKEGVLRFKAAVQQTLQTGDPYALDIEAIHQNGRTVWVTARGEAVRDGEGKIVGIRGTTLDITDRKLAEEALKASEENLRLMVSQGVDAMMVLDKGGVIEAVSSFGTRLLGYDEGELVGKHASDFADTFSRLEASLTLGELRKTAPKSKTVSTRIKTKSGEVQLMGLQVKLLNAGTEAEKYLVKFSRIDFPGKRDGRPQH